MTRMIFIRHGLSMGNLACVSSGQIDWELAPLGIEQASLAKEYIVANEKVDAVYASDLKRAITTARPVAEHFGLPINTDARLREIDTGDWAGVSLITIKENYAEHRAKLATHTSGVHYPNGESYDELRARVVESAREIAEANDGKSVVLAVHQGVVRSIFFESRDGGCDIDPDAKLENASIHIFDYYDGVFHPVRINIVPYPAELEYDYKKGI